ncbi:MAG: polyphosphate polymerase domain-containing protein [Clostridiales bacterium]|jgi:hypothetical protein|nr:polyphosphate polymerase domain-containing protein [Clostridiales bacterium]
MSIARNEYKHNINWSDYLILRSRLAAAMKRDPYAFDNGSYRILSLYFDTPADRALRQKINGTNRREKFRLRRYVGSDYIKLEKKSKVGGLCYKQSVALTLDETLALIQGHTWWMAVDNREIVVELYHKMKSVLMQPKTLVMYRREPFVAAAGNVRVTLDSDIRTGLFSTDFMSDNVPTVKVGDQIAVLEVKYDAFIPDWVKSILQIDNRRASAFSKYALARTYG